MLFITVRGLGRVNEYSKLSSPIILRDKCTPIIFPNNYDQVFNQKISEKNVAAFAGIFTSFMEFCINGGRAATGK